MSELAFKIIFLINQRKESMSVIKCDKCESILTKKDIKSNQCWKCGEVLTQKGKEWYCTECSRLNPDSLNICACGCDRLKEEESSFHGDDVEKPHNMNKTLSKEYGFLRFFQGLIGLSIFIYTACSIPPTFDKNKVLDAGLSISNIKVAVSSFPFGTKGL